MKKNYLLAMSTLMLATSATYALPIPTPQSAKKLVATERLGRDLTKMAPAKSSKVITEAPAGEFTNWTRDGQGYWYNDETEFNDVAGELVFAEDGTVYMNYVIATYPQNAFIKGQLDESGEAITFQLPQTVAEYSWGDYTVNCFNVVDGAFTLAENNTMKYVKTGDGWQLQLADGIEQAIGLWDTDYEEPTGDAIYEDEWKPFNDVRAEIPEGVEAEDWVMRWAYTDGTYDGYNVKVAVDGDKIYIKDFYPDVEGACIVGHIEGDKAIFPNRQYLGVDDSYFYRLFYLSTNRVQEDGKWKYKVTDEGVFNYDPEKKVLTDTESFLVSTAGTYMVYLDSFVGVKFFEQGPIENVGLFAPDFTAYYAYDADYGYGNIRFYLINFSTEGQLLPTERLYYRIYFDGEAYVCSPEDYSRLDEDMELIPYDFAPGRDFYVSGQRHDFYFYVDGFDTIGVQEVYIAEDGSQAESPITTYDVATGDVTTGVKGVMLDAETATSAYFDLNGLRVSRPEKGIFVKVTTDAEGNRQVSKVVK